MFTRLIAGNGSRTDYRKSSFTTITIASLCSLAFLAGCGGGGGGSTPDPSPTPSPVVSPSPSPSPTVSPKDRAIAANFLPNYIPSAPPHYLHWANNKGIRVFLRPTVNNVNDNVASSTVSAARAQSILQQSLDNWGNATGNDFTFTIVNSAAEADIEVVFVDTLLKADGTEAPGVGVTNYQFLIPDVSKILVGELKKSVAQVKANQADANLLDTTSHELGHSLGIEQHSPDSNDLLFATSLPPATITERDQNTLFFLYYSSTATGRAAQVSTAKGKLQSAEIVCDPSEIAHH